MCLRATCSDATCAVPAQFLTEASSAVPVLFVLGRHALLMTGSSTVEAYITAQLEHILELANTQALYTKYSI